FFPHVVSATGRYLAALADVPVGQPLAYLIAPPLESVVGLDAALKAAPVTLQKWFGPPSETNFGGGYLAGALPDCEAAARAFAAAIVDVAHTPRSTTRADAGRDIPSVPARPAADGPFRVLATGEYLAEKPEALTHLADNLTLVPKTHPRMDLRGKLDLCEGHLLDAQVAAHADGIRDLVGELAAALPLPPPTLP